MAALSILVVTVKFVARLALWPEASINQYRQPRINIGVGIGSHGRSGVGIGVGF